MAYSKQVYATAKEKLNNRRTDALNIAEYNRREVFSKFPRLEDIERELNSIGISTARAVLGGKDTATELNALKEKSIALQNEFKDILLTNGYDEKYIEPKFTCALCSDTGYVERDNKTLVCDCFMKLLSSCACDELNKISPLSLSTFDSFNLNYYSSDKDEDGNVPYTRMSKIYDFCLDYAKNFNVNSKGILMRGNTGLGKTHLSLAIANELISNGFSVVYVSAPDILSKLEKEHFSYDYSSEQELMQSLIDCDLLILDDLGTEFATQYTNATMYNIFNSRVNMNKPMIINTNYEFKELEDQYSSRFLSRLMSAYSILVFIGKDIRAR